MQWGNGVEDEGLNESFHLCLSSVLLPFINNSVTDQGTLAQIMSEGELSF